HITDEGKIEGNTRPEPIAMPYSKNKPTNNTGSGSLGSRTGSPVLLASGKLFYTLSDADFIAPIDFGIRRTYLSDRHVGIFGNGWQLGYETRLKQNGSDTVTIFMTDDRAFRFREIENGFIDSDDLGASLTRLDSKTFVLEYFNDMHTERYENGYLSEIKEHNGNTLAFIRNSNGRIAKLFSANASLDFEYNPQGFVSRITDHTQRTWNYAYDRHGNLLRVTDPMGGVAQYHYQQNAPYYLERSIDASSVCTLEVSYDASERVEGYREKGESFSYRYEPNRVIKTNSTGDKTFYGIDTFGAIRAITYPDGSTTKEIYENNVSTVIDAGENCFIREFDERGRIIREARLGNVEILYSYEGDNPYESVKNDNGKITVHTYDARYNLLSTTYPDGKTESWNYDGRGNKVSYTDFTGITSEYAYNGVGQCIRSTDALGGITQYVYDDLGNMTAVVDPEERITAYEYDKLSRQIAITDTDNKTTRLYYDNAGRISAIRDPQGNMTRYLYDSKGLLVRTINPADQVRTFGYERGLLVSIACDNGETYRFTYDQRGRMTSQNVGNKTTKYTYDSLGNLLSAEDGENRVEYVYDAHANVILERQGNESVVYAYNAEGSRRFIGYEGEHYTLGRNESSHLTDIRKGINTYTMGYGMNGKQTSITYPNAHVTKNAFDPLGRLTERTIGNDSKMTYLYDKSSRIVMKNNTPIAYDAGCRVMRAGNESYTYDESGNLLKEESVIDPVTGRLMRQGDTAFTYDSLGRLSEKRSPVSRTTYRYDSQSYLIEYLKTEADHEIRLYFTYDPLGRRLTKHYIGKNGEYHHRYLYAGDNIVAIYDHDTEELLATLLHDETIDTPLSISVHPKEPLSTEEHYRYELLDETEQYLFNQSRIKTYYYHRDYQNSIMMLSDKSGEIIESYEYDVYGNITQHSKILETYNPYGYTGRETDTDDLYYYRARYYDPTIRRFITPDPIGFLGGDTNFYRYVGNDPINYTDPSGLSGLTALLDQHNPLKDLVEWWNATPDTSIPTTSIPNSTIVQGKTNTQTNKPKTVQTTPKTAQTNKGDGGKVIGTASQDCMITNAYFAKRTKQEVVDKSVDYIFAHNNNTHTTAQKKNIAKIIYDKVKSAYGDKYPTKASIEEALTKESYNAGEKITFKLYKKQEVSLRITEASIGEKVTLVATLGGCPAGQSVTFKIYEKSPMLTTAGKELIMLKDGVEVTEVSVASKGTYAAIEVELRPKKDRKSSATDTSPSLELWQEKFTLNKFDHLWLNVSCPSAKNKQMDCLKGNELKFRHITWMFPLDHIPEKSYKDGERQYGANRSGGSRKHAGCDLYAPVGTKIYAMADGIIKSHAPFYNNTNEITIDHGDYIIRYGEVKPYGDGLASGLSIGSTVRQGQHIGYVGQLVFNGGTKSMIHLEIYEKSRASWPLTNRNNPPFQRCEGLINPTSILDQARNYLPKGM
ncbi:RHS repeat-associated core domain-containing protein, partial [Sulfuricurvum sp.]|uniref:RHS repeat-associated core domain-containing protein n=1 Tax=Sulfuricurvum sp. TaxID=2025608 RepID=UPI0026105C58